MQVALRIDSAEVLKRFELAEFRLKNQSQLLDVIATDLSSQMQLSLRRAQSPDGLPWLPLAERTVEARKRVGAKKKGGRAGLRPLQGDTGALRKQLYAQAVGNEVWFGSSAQSKAGFPYWMSHQFGARNAGRSRTVTIPRRAFAPVEYGAGGLVPMKGGRADAFYRRAFAMARRFFSGDISWQR